jgi:hypothetical protein
MWLLLRHATCTLQNATRAKFVSAGLLDVSSLEVQRPRLLDFALKAGLHRMKKIEMTR